MSLAFPGIDQLMKTESLSHLAPSDALAWLGQFIDLAGDEGKLDAVRHAVALSEKMPRLAEPLERATLSYMVSNAWAVLHYGAGGTQDWAFEQDALARQVFHLRCALREHPEQSSELRTRILINLGNVLSHIGRVVEALAFWDRAIVEDPSFGMAIGNRGVGRSSYGGALYDGGHKHLFMAFAHQDLRDAQRLNLEGGAPVGFLQHQRQIEARYPAEWLAAPHPFEEYSLGLSSEEAQYRAWCLSQRLFLNPLNDLTEQSIAAHDVFSTPSILVRAGEGPTLQGFYNQLKQEFVSARFMLYEGIHCQHPHYSDRDVLLWNTLDSPVFSLSAEKLRCAYRIFYGLFDKIAFFLNAYLKLGIGEREVSFIKLWFVDGKQKKGLKPEFLRPSNWLLRGLYWLSKDLFEQDQDAVAAMEPAAQALKKIRDHLEHKYLKLLGGTVAERVVDGVVDTLAHTISRRDFEQKNLHLAKLSRAALIYLSLAVHREESERRAELDPSKILPLELPLISDAAKH